MAAQTAVEVLEGQRDGLEEAIQVLQVRIRDGEEDLAKLRHRRDVLSKTAENVDRAIYTLS